MSAWPGVAAETMSGSAGRQFLSAIVTSGEQVDRDLIEGAAKGAVYHALRFADRLSTAKWFGSRDATKDPYQSVGQGACPGDITAGARAVARSASRAMNNNALPYALGAILLGAVGIWFRDFALQWQPVPAGFPLRVPLAYVSGTLLIVGGIAVLDRRYARRGALLLASATACGC